MIERTVAFGPGDGLPGTLCLPAPGAPRRAIAMLLLDAGVVHRIGPHRINVKLARRLAAHGVASLRFDFSGIGDGVPAPSRLSFDQQAVAEIGAAITVLGRHAGTGRVLVFGVCTGAVHAFAAARADPRIAGIWMQDGYAFPSATTRLRRYLLPLRHEPGRVARALLRRLRRLPASWAAPRPPRRAGDPGPVDAPLGPGGRTPAQFAALLDALAERGTSVRLLYSGSLIGLVNHRDDFARSVPVRAAADRVAAEFAPQIDHTVSNLPAQRALIERVLGWTLEEDRRAAEDAAQRPPRCAHAEAGRAPASM